MKVVPTWKKFEKRCPNAFYSGCKSHLTLDVENVASSVTFAPPFPFPLSLQSVETSSVRPSETYYSAGNRLSDFQHTRNTSSQKLSLVNFVKTLQSKFKGVNQLAQSVSRISIGQDEGTCICRVRRPSRRCTPLDGTYLPHNVLCRSQRLSDLRVHLLRTSPLYSISGPSWPVTGWTSPSPLPLPYLRRLVYQHRTHEPNIT